MDVRLAWVVLALLALVATLSVTEVVRVTAVRLRAVDHPGGRRVHRVPTARLGGLGIFWGFAAALIAATYAHHLGSLTLDGSSAGLIGVLAGAGILLVTGLIDDIYGLPAGIKLMLQIAAGVCVWMFGWRVDSVGMPGLGALSTGMLSLPLTVAWIVLVTNAVNLIDGLDGLAAGIALAATLACAWLLSGTHAPSFLVSAALAGALAGFLWFNVHPALIFMGDTGSLFVGFVLASLTLRTSQLAVRGGFPLIPALLLAVPLLDTAEAIRRRAMLALREGQPPLATLHALRRRLFAPDGLHVHHRLLERGWSMRRAAGTLWMTASGFALLACILARQPMVGMASVVPLAAFVTPRLMRRTDVSAMAGPIVVERPVAAAPIPIGVVMVREEPAEVREAA